MMMAQPFPAHQVGMAQHPGLPPGHPMGPGQHPNAAHMGGQAPGPGMVQQMHPGASGPGGPQGTQAGPIVGGMPPGAGTTGPGAPVPSAHALSHLGPAQGPQLFQQQHMGQNYASNPQLLQQQQQQQLMRQRMMLQQQQQHQHQQQQQQQQHQQHQHHQHQQQQPQQPQQNPQQSQPQQQPQQHPQQQQQPQHGGMPVTLPNGTQGVTAAQMATLQSNPNVRAVNIPPHLQQQLQAQPHHGGQPQNIQQQQMFAMQQQAAQQANNTTQAGQHTPQQRVAAHAQAMHESQNATPQPQQPPSSQGGNTPSQQPGQQLPPSSQPQQHQGPQQQPQQGPNQSQPPQQPPQQQPMSAQEAHMKAQQQAHAPGMMLQQQQQQQRMNPLKGASVLRLVSFAEHLSGFSRRNQTQDLSHFQAFVERFYSQGGVLRQGVWNAQHGGSKKFEISTPVLARYYWTQFNSGVKHIQMIVENATEKDLSTGGHIVESSKTCFIYWFANECQLVAHGKLKAQFDANGKIDLLELDTTGHNEYIPRSLLQAPGSPDPKQSPRVPKATNKKGQRQPAQPAITLPESMVNEHGVPVAVLRFLEVAETISQMQTLFQYSLQNPDLSPPEALRQLVAQLPPQGHMNPAAQQGGQRTPNLNGPSHFASPGVAHLGLPGAQGSPHLGGPAHTPSPAQNPMAGPVAMVAQQSQPGTNTSGSQGTSANTSPNVTNKRRRASTVKVEGEDGNPVEVNGTSAPGASKVKASPRGVGGKRQKGAA